MKQYGANKATEFSRKQISAIYSKAKSGELKVEKWIMNRLYDLADYYGYDDNRSVERSEVKVLEILDAVFGGDLAKAQELIDSFTESEYNDLGIKAQKSANREMVA